MKKIIAINGSPRKNFSTHELLEHALVGAKSVGADVETELVNLYDLNFNGCTSCFECKKKFGKDYCAIEDDISPLLERISNCDGIIFGSPIYMDYVTFKMKGLLERMLYPHHSYDSKQDFSKKNIKTCFIYTMNRSEEEANEYKYEWLFERIKKRLESAFGISDYLVVHETFQFDDYEQMCNDRFDINRRKDIRKNIFPKDCEKAYLQGIRVAL